jgi:predicted ribosome quality control (RQC) complex YloA/Tae2 family protein
MDGLFFRRLIAIIKPDLIGQNINHLDMFENKVLVLNLSHGSFIINLNKNYFYCVPNQINLPETSSHFLTLLRTKIRNGMIINIEQLNYDRVFRLTIKKRNDILQFDIYNLYVELTGNRFNIILTNATNDIIGCINKHQSFYSLPKIKPYQAVENFFLKDNRYSLIAPNILQYMNSNNLSIDDILQQVDSSNLIYNNLNNPHFIELTKDSSLEIPKALDLLFNQEKFENIQNNFRTPVQKQLDFLMGKVQKRIVFLKDSLEDLSYNKYKEDGEYLLTYSHLGLDFINKQRPDIIIPNNLTIIEYANKLFALYKKAKNRLIYNKSEIEKLQEDEQIIIFLKEELSYATRENLIEIKNKLIERKLIKGRFIKPLGKPLLLRIEYKGYMISIGRNSEQNEKVTFSLANKEDVFLHVHNYPGSHVIISPFTDDKDILNYAAKQAKKYSSLSEEKRATIDYTQVKYVKHSPEHHGKVVLLQFSTLEI